MKRNYDASTSFLDLLFNALLGFVALFALAFVQIHEDQSKKNQESTAEFVITMTWPKEIDNDVDIYVADPNDQLVFYRTREDGLMSLDRDDTGVASDTIETETGEIIAYDDNREVVSIRGIIPGEYIINVHMYALNGDELDTPVTIQVDKLNPFSTIAKKTVTIREAGDEKTAVRFKIDKSGKVTDVNDLEFSLIEKFIGQNPARQDPRR